MPFLVTSSVLSHLMGKVGSVVVAGLVEGLLAFLEVKVSHV